MKTEQEFLSKACNPQYGAWLVDLGESPGQRFKIIEDLRSQKILTPALGFNGSAADLAPALEKGFDDYLAKPTDSGELVARLKALLRRSSYAKAPTTLFAGDIALDLLKRQARRAEKLIDLQPREFAMLEFMIRNPEIPLSKLMIMQNVWNYNFDPQTNIVDVLICRLRNKIESGFSTSVIQTIRGVGYKFTPRG